MKNLFLRHQSEDSLARLSLLHVGPEQTNGASTQGNLDASVDRTGDKTHGSSVVVPNSESGVMSNSAVTSTVLGSLDSVRDLAFGAVRSNPSLRPLAIPEVVSKNQGGQSDKPSNSARSAVLGALETTQSVSPSPREQPSNRET
ncbi:MAG: hypothetical protein K2X29_15365, partial [Candidatus Obscuribacterales bacterium]|nr:hypothetical protein [Candidatus Obscuribacterales bacterium]